MINNYDILDGLLEQMKDSSTLINHHATIAVGECVNESLNAVPWIGVYLDTVTHDAHTITSQHRRWQAEPKLIIVVQQTSLKSGADCLKRLAELVRDVMNVIVNDTDFGNTIDMVTDLDISYSYNKTDRPSLHFQTAYISITCKVENRDDENC